MVGGYQESWLNGTSSCSQPYKSLSEGSLTCEMHKVAQNDFTVLSKCLVFDIYCISAHGTVNAMRSLFYSSHSLTMCNVHWMTLPRAIAVWV